MKKPGNYVTKAYSRFSEPYDNPTPQKVPEDTPITDIESLSQDELQVFIWLANSYLSWEIVLSQKLKKYLYLILFHKKVLLPIKNPQWIEKVLEWVNTVLEWIISEDETGLDTDSLSWEEFWERKNTLLKKYHPDRGWNAIHITAIIKALEVVQKWKERNNIS